MKKIVVFLLMILLSVTLSGCVSSKSNDSNESGENSIYERTQNNSPQVKKSSTGICHEIGSTYYSRTANFVAYNSISECLNSGGRLPKK